MIVLIREEKKIYSLVEISDELRDTLVENGLELVCYDDRQLGRKTLSSFVEDKLPRMGKISSRVMTEGSTNDKTPALAIDRGPDGEILLYQTYLTTEQMFFMFDNSDGECLGTMTNIIDYIKESSSKKRQAFSS